jgi:5-formyltetrahydrofolate cyclo-ligase
MINKQKIDIRNEVKMRMQKEVHFLNEKSRIITDRIFKNQHIFSAKVWFVYLSLADEVNTFSLIEKLFQENKKVCVPKIINNQIYPIKIESLQDLQK